MSLLFLTLLACAPRPLEGALARGVVVPEDFAPAQVLAVVASSRADPPLVEALSGGGARVRALSGPALTAGALEAALADQLAKAGPRDTFVIALSMPLAGGAEVAFLGADVRLQAGRLRGALTLDHLEALLLESAAGRVIVLVEPEGSMGETSSAALDEGLARLARARAGVVALRVPRASSPLCVADLDGDGARSVGELSAALGGRLDVPAGRAELPWAADRCGAPGPVILCLFEDGEPVPPTHAFSSGAAVSLSLSPVSPGYLALISEPSGAPAALVLPRPPEPPWPVGSKGEARLPPAGEALRLSGDAETERLRLIWTASPIQGLEALRAEVARASAGAAALTAQARAVDRCALYSPVGDGAAWEIVVPLTRN